MIRIPCEPLIIPKYPPLCPLIIRSPISISCCLFMDIGARVWVRDRSSGDWVMGVLKSRDPDKIQVQVDHDSTRLESYPNNPDSPDIHLMNRVDAAEVDNLITLMYLNEPSIL